MLPLKLHNLDLFVRRRENFLKWKEIEGKVAVFFSAKEYIRNYDVHHSFRQESNFYYLTGFEEPEAIFLLVPDSKSGRSHKSVLFVRDRNVEREIWDGERYGTDRAKTTFQMDEVYSIKEFDSYFEQAIKTVVGVCYTLGLDEENNQRVLQAIQKQKRETGRSGKAHLTLVDPSEFIGEARLHKSAEEISYLRKAGQISALAHLEAMKKVRPGMNELEVEGLLDYEFKRRGSRRRGYDSIVAGGANACCLHYRFNNDDLKNGDLLLIDAGTEYEYYTGDITRTFPVGKTFSKEQRELYEVVLNAQKKAMEMIRPGVVPAEIHKKASETLAEGLCRLGLLQGNPEELVKEKKVHRFYPHGTGHWLGMDVHDAGLYQVDGTSRKLVPGMCFTVEPGIYVQPDDKDAPEKYRGIGIRIEDNVVVTANGVENFTQDAPKEIAEIEALRAQAF